MRLATLLTCFGESAYTVYNSIKFDTEADKQKIDIVLTKLKDYCVGQTNEIYERYIFNRRIQEPNEDIDSLLTALTTLSKDCNYGELRDSLIRDRIVFGIRDSAARKRILQMKTVTLDACVDIARAYETTDQCSKNECF